MQTTIAIVGRGRVGPALAAALSAAGRSVLGPLGRGVGTEDADVVLLCVPDAQIAAAARAIEPRKGLVVGHCSGATGMDVLRPHEGLGLHPLMTIAHADATLAGAGCAVAGTTLRALKLAEEMATDVGMTPFPVVDDDRAAYHAAASIASNYLITLEAAAERVAGTAGVPREALIPLVRAAVENWAALGPREALTGPIARGDDAVVARQRMAVAARAPELLGLFDALTEATRALARGEDPSAPANGSEVGP